MADEDKRDGAPAWRPQTELIHGGIVRSHTPAGALIVVCCAMAVTVLSAWLLHVAIEQPAIRLASRIRWTK